MQMKTKLLTQQQESFIMLILIHSIELVLWPFNEERKVSTIQNQNTTPLCNAKDGAQETSLNSLENVVRKGKITFQGKAQSGEGNKEERELVREENLSIKRRPHVH